ncbi:36441_t:CDS:2 [Gigaspora margarita]|uniref:36441_t:CDS:1 n=1 Tax=Gigaspora margarita TaxID=4874 RepID=A0ABN7VR90_GIGMA|nr:36441_t:CDS:2 [Gigaspora margarita]
MRYIANLLLPLNTYKAWIKEEESIKKINFIKSHGTYENNEFGSWTEYYVCSHAGKMQVHYDHIEGENSQKKCQVQKKIKKSWLHTPGSHANIQCLKKSKETIAKIKRFAQQ